MKATVFYDKNGDIQSLVLVNPDAKTTPQSGDYASIEVEIEEITPERIAEIHSGHRVDPDQQALVRR